MTPELKAAAERVRRISNGEFFDAVYGRNLSDLGQREFWMRDRELLADAYLAEHPADDDEPVDLDWLEEQLHDSDFTVSQIGWKFFVQFEGRIEIKTRGQLRALLKGLGV